MNAKKQQKSGKKLLLSAEKLNVSIRGKAVLKNVDLHLTDDDFITIVGPNGAGKSTLLKVILGMIPTTQGKIYRKPGLRIGYVPQQFEMPVIMPMTVDRFLQLIQPSSTHLEPFEDLSMMGIENLKHKFMHQLSGGERQRVMIVRALLQNPDVLILDEPAQNLDVRGQLDLYQFLSKLYQNNPVSILMVSHDLHMVMSLTTHVICLYGHVCCAGEPKVITKDPAFEDVFGQELVSMMSAYHHHHGEDHD